MGLRAAVAVVVLSALGSMTGLVPAGASPAAAVPPSACSTERVLPTVEGPHPDRSAVYGLSLHDRIAVGQSKGLPAYWVGDVLHRVPLPSGYTQGAVLSVNRFGLMVGYLAAADDDVSQRAFRYWPGNRSVSFYPVGSRATDVNDAGQAVGFTWGRTGIYEFGPGLGLSRKLSLPPGYSPWINRELGVDLQVNNAGYVVATGSGGSGWDDSFSWSPSSTGPRQVLDQHIVSVPASESNDTTYGSFVAAAIDNRNRLVGHEERVTVLDDPLGWKSLGTRPQHLAYEGPEDLIARLVALSDRTGLAAGYATRWVDFRGGTPPFAGPDVAVVWDGDGPITTLASTSLPAHAYSAQDDGRIGGWVGEYASRRPAVWTCDVSG